MREHTPEPGSSASVSRLHDIRPFTSIPEENGCLYRSLVSVYRVFERHVHLLLSVLGWVLSSSLYERTCFLYLEDLSRAESDLGSYRPS